jgi:glycosyltransferase involved in cell wall biosynthesis
MSELIEISVIIPTLNRRHELRQCLLALASQTFPAAQYEVIVIDDGSGEDIQGVVQEVGQGAEHWRYFRQASKGPAAARNQGIRLARGALVAMTDSDTLPAHDWLAKLAEAFAQHAEAVGVEGKVHALNEGAFGILGEGPTNKQGGVYLTCNCAYRREVLLKVGGFDESFPFAAYEDTELAARAKTLGPIVWQPQAVVVHPERPLTSAAVLKKLRHWEYILIVGFRYGYLGWEKYPVKHPKLRVALLSLVALPLAKFRHALAWLTRQPAAAVQMMLFGVLEALGALTLVVPRVLLTNYDARIERKHYL